jgi:hypothetical protein
MAGDQTTVTANDVVEVLLDEHGRTFADEAGIGLARNQPAPLFRLLSLAVVVSARVSALGQTAELVVERYGGDLRRLRAEAGGDRAAMRDALTGLEGVGDVGASFFMREVQLVWVELVPFADDQALEAAAILGLPVSAPELARFARDPGTFTRLVAGLVRVGLAGAHDSVLDRAAERPGRRRERATGS